jgi:hypothetical protein
MVSCGFRAELTRLQRPYYAAEQLRGRRGDPQNPLKLREELLRVLDECRGPF